MNIWQIRRLCHYLRCAADNRKIADFQREQAATVIETLLDQVEDILGDTYDLDRLRELVEADKAGRLAILSEPMPHGRCWKGGWPVVNTSKHRHDGGACRRCKNIIAAHAKAGKDRSKAGKRKKGKK